MKADYFYIYLKERNEEKGRKYFTTHIAGGSPQSANDEEYSSLYKTATIVILPIDLTT